MCILALTQSRRSVTASPELLNPSDQPYYNIDKLNFPCFSLTVGSPSFSKQLLANVAEVLMEHCMKQHLIRGPDIAEANLPHVLF